MPLKELIFALLFYKNEPVTIAWLAKASKRSADEVKTALTELKTENRGVVVMEAADEVMLGTNPELSSTIEAIAKEELSGELSRAALETLSVVLYKGPISRSNIDYIRGVNSQFSLRHLSVRGLIERMPNPHDSRSFLYMPSMQLLAELGVTNVSELPDYNEVVAKLREIESRTNNEETAPTTTA